MPSELLERLRQGDDAAYREAVKLHGDGLYTFLARLTGRRDLAEDLFQETWLALARTAPKLAPDTQLGPWLYTVARNAYRSHRRWSWVDVSRWLVIDPVDDVASGAPSPLDASEANQALRDLERAMARLRPVDREILLLHAVDAFDSGVVESILDLAPEARRQRLARARKALAEELRRNQKGDLR